ncbi:MAG: archaeal proteasome endopeptidase complex subunit alpha [Candidatus Aenigmarchaeota archaeon]|nr:archaeal proteasome endopeptidase complex subunit alpha [Candidatus Aenigmarchaeota archaeon]MCX8190728.1 archaeal proteasome endopeptidase complex subunit alpha [Candidatus Aenigmarchaeota archaeon]MDW8159976.1 archaeal proteasome endopeptidase complex subunit alpha [Candidatus Aenigmarchaeota archaeon]
MAGEGLTEAMGYDRTIAMFSPDGRLFQVEYAKEAVKRGVTALGIVFNKGVLLATAKILDELMAPSSIEKIFKIDDHIGAVAAGYLADARVLVDFARVKAQSHRITFEEPIGVWSLAKEVGDRMQLLTQYGGLRPYGVSIIFGGEDDTGPHLIESDPSGMLFEWYAYSIGRGSQAAIKILKEEWNQKITKKEAVKLAVNILEKTEKVDREKIDLAIIEGGKFRVLSLDEVEKLLK